MVLKISSLNVNGLRQKFKQDIIFSRFSNLGFDIVFLQETHVTNIAEASKFTKLWEGKKLVFWHNEKLWGGHFAKQEFVF